MLALLVTRCVRVCLKCCHLLEHFYTFLIWTHSLQLFSRTLFDAHFTRVPVNQSDYYIWIIGFEIIPITFHPELLRAVSRRPLFPVTQNNTALKMTGRSLLSWIRIFWSFLACCFLAALCVHKLSRKYQTWRLYIVFQDLIRYGKTKQNLKRDEWLRVFDVPKR